MGSGSKFDSLLSTRGGVLNFITSDNISKQDKLSKEMLDEMAEKGINFTKDKIVFAVRLENNEFIFLEKDRLCHIIERHGSDFERAFGVKNDEISPLLSDTISKGKLVFSKVKEKNGIKFYSNKYYYKGMYSIVYGIAENGYIETAYPKSNGGK